MNVPSADRNQQSWSGYAPSQAAEGPTPPGRPDPVELLPPTTVWLSPDYSAPSPLWPLSVGTNDLVPESLLAELIAWQEDFNANFWDTGWRSEEAKIRWSDASVSLVEQVREALAGKAELIVDLWPLGEPQRTYPCP